MNVVHVEPYSGSRAELRWLFELAEDSPVQLDSYLTAGRILVARQGTDVVGHLQLVETDVPGEVELKNMAVREDRQGRGIGARLVRAAWSSWRPNRSRCWWSPRPPPTSVTSASTNARASGCAPSSETPSTRPPATEGQRTVDRIDKP